MKISKYVMHIMLAAAIALGLCACDRNNDNADKLSEFAQKAAKESDAVNEAEDIPQDKNHVKDGSGFERDARGYILSYEGEGEKVEIPKQIDGMDIIGIAYRAFYENTDITEIVMPDTVIAIEASAFEGCSNLAFVDFSSSLESIDNHAFAKCTSLMDVELPKSCTYVGDSAFSFAGHAVFAGSGAEYGNRCFEGCSFDQISFSKGADLSGYGIFMDSNVRDVKFPEDLTNLGESAFTNCKNIKKIELPDTVTELGEGVFSNMGMLEVLRLPEGLITLPVDMTVGTSTDVVFIPKSVEKICSHSIYDACIAVIQNPGVEIEPGGVSASYVCLCDAKNYVFPSVDEDEEVMTGDKLYLDGVYSSSDIQGDFYAATSFGEQVYLAADATEKESDAFDEWLVSLEYPEITWIAGVIPEFIPDSTINFTVEDGVVTGWNLEEDTLTIPNYVLVEDDGFWIHSNVTDIADEAFSGSSCRTVYLSGRFWVGSRILAGNSNLSDIWLNGTILMDVSDDKYNADSFEGIPENVTVHIPASLTDKERSEVEVYLHGAGMPDTVKFDYYSLR